MLEALVVLLLLAAGYGFWSIGQRQKQRALLAVTRDCQQQQLQLLDATLIFTGITIQQRQIVWCYQFEFSSTGDERYMGRIQQPYRGRATIQLPAYRTRD